MSYDYSWENLFVVSLIVKSMSNTADLINEVTNMG